MTCDFRLSGIALTLLTGLSVTAGLAADRPLDVRGTQADPLFVAVPIEGVPTSGPNCEPVARLPQWRGVWLGHFSGGNYPAATPTGSAVDWHSDYACFPTQTACQRWQRAMRVAYRRLEGYRTCLLMR